MVFLTYVAPYYGNKRQNETEKKDRFGPNERKGENRAYAQYAQDTQTFEPE